MYYKLLPCLALAFMLGGCDSQDPAPSEQLQSVTVTGPNNNLIAQTQLDYNAGMLTRVRSYASAPGPDGIGGTADDVAMMTGYATCTVSRKGNQLLHDAYTEAYGLNASVSSYFSALPGCAVPGLSASHVSSTSHGAGPDQQWLTADDTEDFSYTLSRTPHGSTITIRIPRPADTSCNVNCTGLNHVVYNPYADITATARTTEAANSYEYDARGRINGITSNYILVRYGLDADGFVTVREVSTLPDSNGNHSGFIREEYSKAYDGSLHVRQMNLNSSVLLDSISGSPTGDILMQLLGWFRMTALDGNSYTAMDAREYSIQRTGKRIDQIRYFVDTGPDHIFHTDDDRYVTANFKYVNDH